jgi:rubredoxin
MKCSICGHIYDPKKGDAGIPAGTAFENVSDEWTCPVCGAAKSKFKTVT